MKTADREALVLRVKRVPRGCMTSSQPDDPDGA
jgi:hypothetical protein